MGGTSGGGGHKQVEKSKMGDIKMDRDRFEMFSTADIPVRVYLSSNSEQKIYVDIIEVTGPDGRRALMIVNETGAALINAFGLLLPYQPNHKEFQALKRDKETPRDNPEVSPDWQPEANKV